MKTMKDPNLPQFRHVRLVPLTEVARGRRPSLFDLWLTYQFQPELLAFFAGVSHLTITAMLCYQPVPLAQVQDVLAALSELLRKKFTFTDVDIPIEKEENTDESTK